MSKSQALFAPSNLITTAIAAIEPQLAHAEKTIIEARGSEASAYRSIIYAIAEHRSALEADNGYLRPGVAASIIKRHPEINQTTLSSGWSAYKRNPDAFAQATAVRAFAEIARGDDEPAEKSTADKKLAARRALENALKRCKAAGVRPSVVDALFDDYYNPDADDEPTQASAPAPTVQPAPAPVVAEPQPAQASADSAPAQSPPETAQAKAPKAKAA